MTRIAILSDIHSNWQAMKAVMREVQNRSIDRVICLGDAVGYGADPERCVQLLRDIKAGMVMGNHEYETLRIRYWGTEHMGKQWKHCGYACGLVHSAKSLSQENIDWLTKLPAWGEVERSLVAHADLKNPMAYYYVESLEDAESSIAVLRSRGMEVAFFGHTHVQEVFSHEELDWIDETKFRISVERPCVVMVGSAGQSRMKGDLRAAWAIYDSAAGMVELCRTEYDRLAAAQAMIAAGLPKESAARLLTDEECKRVL